MWYVGSFFNAASLSEVEEAEITCLCEEHKAKKGWTGTVNTHKEVNTPHATLGSLSTFVVDTTAPPNPAPIATATVDASTMDAEDSKPAAKTLCLGCEDSLCFGVLPRTPKHKQNPSEVASNKPRYKGPVYLPNHIFDMLSEEVKKELDKYNQEKKADSQPSSNWIPKVHIEEHGDEDHPKNPKPDLDN